MLRPLLLCQHLLYKFVLSEIGKGVSVVAKHIACEELDAVFVADLVNLHDDVPGAARQADLREGGKRPGVSSANCGSLPCRLNNPERAAAALAIGVPTASSKLVQQVPWAQRLETKERVQVRRVENVNYETITFCSPSGKVFS